MAWKGRAANHITEACAGQWREQVGLQTTSLRLVLPVPWTRRAVYHINNKAIWPSVSLTCCQTGSHCCNLAYSMSYVWLKKLTLLQFGIQSVLCVDKEAHTSKIWHSVCLMCCLTGSHFYNLALSLPYVWLQKRRWWGYSCFTYSSWGFKTNCNLEANALFCLQYFILDFYFKHLERTGV